MEGCDNRESGRSLNLCVKRKR